jgi:glycosyltransferase involved in cell wall biosynthesis
VFASQLSEQLRRDGHEVRTSYLYPHEGESALPLTPHDQVLGGREHHVFETVPGIHPMLARRLRQCIDEMRPDVVQANGGRTVKYGAAVASTQPGRSWSLVYRNIGQPRYWVGGCRHAFYSRFVMPHVDGVVGVSGATLQSVKTMYALSVPTASIPCAVDPEVMTPTITREEVRHQTGTPANAPVIVWAGSLSHEKRVDRLLAAASIVRNSVPDVHVWIVGTGPLRQTIEAQVLASPLASSVRFLGAQDRVANYMSAADLLALTSDTEGMPAVVLEAGLLGLPVVATRVGGVPECVLDGETGLVVDQHDAQSLVRGLVDLLRQPERRASIGRAARTWIERNFTMSRVARQYAEFYQQVLVG